MRVGFRYFLLRFTSKIRQAYLITSFVPHEGLHSEFSDTRNMKLGRTISSGQSVTARLISTYYADIFHQFSSVVDTLLRTLHRVDLCADLHDCILPQVGLKCLESSRQCRRRRYLDLFCILSECARKDAFGSVPTEAYTVGIEGSE